MRKKNVKIGERKEGEERKEGMQVEGNGKEGVKVAQLRRLIDFWVVLVVTC